MQTALSEDIHLLGDLLGAIIRRLAGQRAFELEEDVRAAAKALRAKPSVDAARELYDRLNQLDVIRVAHTDPGLRFISTWSTGEQQAAYAPIGGGRCDGRRNR